MTETLKIKEEKLLSNDITINDLNAQIDKNKSN
jgi:hypothetical protein